MTSTAPATDVRSGLAPHEHGWALESAHRTSEGLVLYVRCAVCGARRVDLGAGATAPPLVVSDVLPRAQSER